MSAESDNTGARVIDAGPQVAQKPFVMTLPGGSQIDVVHVPTCGAGEISFNGEYVITMMCLREGCPCGCGAKGLGLLAILSAESARTLADRLNELASSHEAAAKLQAEAVIGRAQRGDGR